MIYVHILLIRRAQYHFLRRVAAMRGNTLKSVSDKYQQAIKFVYSHDLGLLRFVLVYICILCCRTSACICMAWKCVKRHKHSCTSIPAAGLYKTDTFV